MLVCFYDLFTQANDRAVMQAYGMPIRETDEAACVAWLMRLYQGKVAEDRKTCCALLHFINK